MEQSRENKKEKDSDIKLIKDFYGSIVVLFQLNFFLRLIFALFFVCILSRVQTTASVCFCAFVKHTLKRITKTKLNASQPELCVHILLFQREKN